jgi:uncharacterized protein (UPF0218 family)
LTGECGTEIVYTLTPELREKFKQPFGLLVRGTSAETTKKLGAIVNREKPPNVVSVGDRVSRNLHEHGISPHVAIMDNRSLRKRVHPATFQAEKVFHVKNPQGTITREAAAAVQAAFRGSENVHIIVDGEEDLLALVAVRYAPDGALIVYGQPHEGVVVVKVTAEKRAEAQRLLDVMACSGKAK